jgi:sulfur relay (sulfurtransferase) DsrC/TusE family protein
MSSVLRAIWDKFGCSEPVFDAQLSDDQNEVVFVVRNKYKPNDVGVTDPVEQMMIRCYREEFSRSDRRFVKTDYIANVHHEIVKQLREFYAIYSPLKNPSQSRLYRWLYREVDVYNSSLLDGLVYLYRYIKSNENENGRFDGGKENPHVKNALAILEKMKEKYAKN